MNKLTYKTTLDKFGRVLIPKKIRVNLGLTPGCDLTVEEHDTEIALYPVTEESISANSGDTILNFTIFLTSDMR